MMKIIEYKDTLELLKKEIDRKIKLLNNLRNLANKQDEEEPRIEIIKNIERHSAIIDVLDEAIDKVKKIEEEYYHDKY